TSQRQKGGGAQDRFRLGESVVVHQNDVGGARAVSRFEQTARETAGSAVIVLLDEMQPACGGSYQGVVIPMVAYLLVTLIDHDHTIQDLGNVRVRNKTDYIVD